MKTLINFAVIATMFLQTGFLSGISVNAQGEATETPTIEPTNTPEPTATETASTTPTLEPTNTPEPTATGTASATPIPSETPAPTETAAIPPSETPTTIPPTPPAITQEVTLNLSSNPTFLKRGGELNVEWSIEGLGETAKGMTLRFYLPTGITVIDPKIGTLNKAGDTFDVEATALKGGVGFKVGEEVVSPLTITAELLRGEEGIAKAELQLIERNETMIESKGGKAQGLGGRVQVTFPSGALSERVKLSIEKPSKESLPVRSLSGSAFEITAVSEQSRAEVSQFSEPVEIQVRYSEAGMTSEEDLRLYWYDPADGYWKQILNQRVDTENNILIAYTEHFSVFDAYNSNWQTAETPTLEAFQHSGFTGAASFSMPIKVPAGPGGFQPSLTLSYSSSTVDNAGSDTQASWAGMGWSLSPSYIERNGHGTNSTLDDSFSVNLNGMSMELLPGADGKFHAADENFYKVEYDLPLPGGESESAWTIWDKSGNQYIFDTRTEFLEEKNCPGDPIGDGIDFNTYVWRWSLTKTVNIYSKEMTYSYANDTKSMTYLNCNGGFSNKTVNTYTYPSTITYANGRYQILFTRVGRTDYKDLWASPYNYSYTAYQQSLLKTVQVKQDADGDGTFETTIRKYVFNYATAPDTIFPDLVWEAGGLTPTLLSVREYGLGGGGTPLPGYTFTYGDDMHLTSATNGYGGTATFEYENWNESIPYQSWDAGADGRISESEIPAWGNPRMYKFTDWAEGWAAAGALPNMVTHTPGGTGAITVTGLARNPNTGNSAFSFQPGRWYLIVASAKKTSGTGNQMRLGVRYQQGSGSYQTLYGSYTTLTTSYKTISSGLIYLPMNATSFEPRIDSQPGSNGSNTVDWIAIYPMPTAYRVTARTLSAASNSYTFTYAYSGAATNSPAISADAGGPHPYNKPYTEFRGHSTVTETDPYGKKVITNYYQDDCTSGRSSMVTIKNENNKILQRTHSTYACTSTNSTINLKDKDTRNPLLYDTYFDPLIYRWVRTASESRDVYGGSPNGVVASTLTEYGYDSTYGNLIAKTVSGTGIETTTTTTDYYPRTSGGLWLVSLPARVTVTNEGGTMLSRSLNLYDGANTFNTAPTVGILTATRTLISGTNYSQASMTYDAWGNVTSQTTWTGYGAANADPTEGAQTSYACYGSQESLGGKWCPNNAYHTYALWTKNAKGHVSNVTYDYSLGLPISATDPNGAVTSATYDVFGRFTGLTKPGDSSPTLTVSYQNNPFKVTLNQVIDATHTFTVVRNYDGMGRQTSTVTNGVTVASTFNAYGKPLTQSMPHTTGAWFYTTTEYDSMGRPISVTAPDGTSTSYAYNGLSTTVTDANNHSTTTVTNILGQTLSVTPPTGPNVVFTYDPLGNLLTATRGGATTTLTYDKAGRKTRMVDADMGTWNYSYDALGNMISQTNALNCVTNLSYDALNRVTGKTYSNCPATSAVTYTYDSGTNGKGRKSSVGNGSGLTVWTYDARGRILTEAKQITGGGQFVTNWTYNTADLPISMTYPDGEVVNSTYNNQMQLTSVIGANVYVQSMTYDSSGRPLHTIRGAGTLDTSNVYYPWNQQGGRLRQLITTRPVDQATLQNLAYGFDPVGNVLTITDSLSGPQAQAFTYDALDRLISANATGGIDGLYDENYSYDSLTGNLSGKGEVNYTYASGHAHAVSSLSNGNTYGYDSNGNMTTRSIASGPLVGAYTLTYDGENRLVGVTKNGSTVASYSYNSEGKQVKSTVNGTTTYYTTAQYEVSGSNITKYYFAGSTRVAVRKNGVLYFLLGDHLGSNSVTTNASGAKTAQMSYKAWGETRFSSGNPITNYRFTGQREEEEIGLYYYGARWVDVSLGRFTQADTVIPQQNQGVQAWDRYAYTNNSPARYTDPSGHCISDPVSFLVCAMVAGAVIGAAVNAYNQYQDTGTVDAGQVLNAAAEGALIAGGAVIVGMVALSAASALLPAATIVGSTACADGDCTNEVNAVAAAGGEAVQALSADGDPTNEVTAITKYYPPQMGFAGEPIKTQFQEGNIIANVGGGRFFTLPGTSSSSVSLPYGKIGLPTDYYEVVKPFTVYAGQALSWFGQPGLGTQYMCPVMSAATLVDQGYIIPCAE